MEEYREDEKAYQRDISNYNLVPASISVGVAVLLVVAGLVWISGLPIIGEGAVLGAVFTLFYGLIPAFMTNSSDSARWPWGS